MYVQNVTVKCQYRIRVIIARYMILDTREKAPSYALSTYALVVSALRGSTIGDRAYSVAAPRV